MSRLLILLPVLAAAFLPIYFLYLRPDQPVPEVDLQAWWGANPPKEDTRIRPFKIKFEDELIKDLRNRLKNHRQFTPPLEGIGFQYGFNTKTLETWVQYWQTHYDFTAREQFFNQYSHFKTNIQGLDIHFIRVTPQAPAGVELVPVLLLHGWPGSVREFYEAIPHLTAVSKDRNFALELIIPSLPGYGFSEGAVRPGFGPIEMAVVLRNLMHRIGFEQFYVQGGDWGSIIAANIATLFPREVLGYHANVSFLRTSSSMFFTLLGSLYPPLVVESHLADRMYPLSKTICMLLEESGYLHIQATKPDTIGVGLLDSPSGLLAYVVEKFSTGTNITYRELVDGGLERKFTKDKILDNLMMYWAPGSIVTAIRLYAEGFNKKYTSLKMDEVPTPVPTWIIQVKNDVMYVPPFLIRQKYHNLLGSPTLDYGGHFFALELPEVFSGDLLKAIGTFQDWHKENNIRHVEM